MTRAEIEANARAPYARKIMELEKMLLAAHAMQNWIDLALLRGQIEPKVADEARRMAADYEAAKLRAQPQTATLWFVTYCTSSVGVWSCAWYGTQAEAEAFHAAHVAQHGTCTDQTGAYGDSYPVTSADVTLTPAGVLQFIRNYGAPDE